MTAKSAKKIGLALGGGGARGLAHIGVIKALLNAGIAIDYIAGTSMGAVVGGWYATMGEVNSLENMFLDMKHGDIFPGTHLLKAHDGNLFRDTSIMESFKQKLEHHSFGKTKIPFRAVATDMKTGEEVVLKDGDIVDAIAASSAIPFVFKPVSISGRSLMDGGFSNPVPADVVRAMGAEYVIAIDISSQWIDFSWYEMTGVRGIYDAISNALSVVEYQLARHTLEKADIVLRPPVMHHSWLAFDRAREIVDAGMDEGHLALKKIRKGAGYAEPTQTFADELFELFFDKK